MLRPCCLLIALTLTGLVAPAAAQDGGDGIGALLNRIERVLPGGDPSALRPLLSPNVAPGVMDTFAPQLLTAPFRRAVVHEREREPLDGALPGDGFRLTADLLLESERTARIVTARLDVRRAPGDTAAGAWRLVSAQVVTLVEGLHRLEPSAATQYAVEGLTIRSEDLVLSFSQGTAVPVESERGLVGLVIAGTGQMTFTPRPAAEQGQVRLFAGADTLTAPLETAFIRLNPADVALHGLDSGLREQPVDPRVLRRARELFDADAPRSFNLDLGDLSREPWYVLPPSGDFLAELHTRGRGHLTYARSFTEAEDISLFERARGRDIARYASVEKEQQRGVSYNEDALNEIAVLDYDVDATIDPGREFIDARARLRIRVQAAGVAAINIRLAEPLVVTSAVSPQYGPLVHLRVRGRDSVILNLPVVLQRGSEFVVAVNYSGRLRSQAVDQEALGQDGFSPTPFTRPQDYYLLSTKSYWYPQPQTSGYATATLRLTLPADFTCTATGEPLEGFRTVVSASGRPMRAWAFRAFEPVRYLSVLAGRFRPAIAGTLPLVDEPTGPAARPAEGTRQPGFRVREYMPFDQLGTESVSRRRLADLAAWTTDIFRFYLSRMGDAPYPRLTLAVVENATPGGHSPAATALVFNPRPGTMPTWRDDPASFDGFPEFFLAHELAHQWWGHGVGWANYHEQWLSEGFAQYFAALYAEHRHGPDVLEQMLRQFRRWTLEASDQGPISLGYRLGQMKGDKRIFRALVYNKAAGVLHMLRRLIGDDAFFDGLRRIYETHRLEKAGTAQVQAAFEAASGRPLGRFFEQWIGGARLPRLRVTQTVADREAVVTFEHLDGVFDLPVTVSLVYADGRTVDTVVPVAEERVERRLPLDGPLRQVRINRDNAALAVFEGP
ncbi:MAG: M1 family metallopeptidase [Vicinamibacterales bacterium]